MQAIHGWQEYAYWKVNRPPCYIRCSGGRVNELWAFALRGMNKKFPSLDEIDVKGEKFKIIVSLLLKKFLLEKVKQASAKTTSPSKVLKLSCNR